MYCPESLSFTNPCFCHLNSKKRKILILPIQINWVWQGTWKGYWATDPTNEVKKKKSTSTHAASLAGDDPLTCCLGCGWLQWTQAGSMLGWTSTPDPRSAPSGHRPHTPSEPGLFVPKSAGKTLTVALDIPCDTVQKIGKRWGEGETQGGLGCVCVCVCVKGGGGGVARASAHMLLCDTLLLVVNSAMLSNSISSHAHKCVSRKKFKIIPGIQGT